MLGPLDYALWLLGAVAQAMVFVCALRARAYRRYFTLFLYILLTWIFAAGRFLIFFGYGLTSNHYIYFYYYSDAFLTICLYFTLMDLYSHVFQEMGVSRYLRVGALLLLGGTAWFSYQVVHGASDKMISRFVVQLSQNLYFVGVVLTYVLWGGVVKMRETRTQLIQLVLGLGVYFSAFAANYALWNLFPNLHQVWRYVPPMMGIWLPLAWAYTFAKVPEEARLATAELVHSR